MGIKAVSSMLPEGRYSSFKNATVYVGKNDGKGGLGDLMFSYTDDDGNEWVGTAASGWIETTNGSNILHLWTRDGTSTRSKTGWGPGARPTSVPLGVKPAIRPMKNRR